MIPKRFSFQNGEMRNLMILFRQRQENRLVMDKVSKTVECIPKMNRFPPLRCGENVLIYVNEMTIQSI